MFGLGGVRAGTGVIAEASPRRSPAQDLGTCPHTPKAVRRGSSGNPIAYAVRRLRGRSHRLGVGSLVRRAEGDLPRRDAGSAPAAAYRPGEDEPPECAAAGSEPARPAFWTPIRVPTATEEVFRDLVRAQACAVEHLEPRTQSTLLQWGDCAPGPVLGVVLAPSPMAARGHADAGSPGPRVVGTADVARGMRRADCPLRPNHLQPNHLRGDGDAPDKRRMTARQALRGVLWVIAATRAPECGDLVQFPGPPHLRSVLG